MKYNVLIIGAGFAGSVLAERIANAGFSCLVIDKRNHIGGNSYDEYNDAGILIHKYGPHYFRSDYPNVVKYLSKFTDWRYLNYKVKVYAENRLWSFPFNLTTFEQLIGKESTTEEMESILAKWRIPINNPQNSEDIIISKVGRRVFNLFYKNYTYKQWNRWPSELDTSVCARIPIRTNRDDRYLSESFQAMPNGGYTLIFEKLLANKLIDVKLNTDFKYFPKEMKFNKIIYTGPIDEYFENCYGSLPYRSLRFEQETYNREFYQDVMQINYPNDYDYTRIVEIKHATGQKSPVTTIMKEFPLEHTLENEPYYPIPFSDTFILSQKYKNLAKLKAKNVLFIGRLATYQYLNMDQIVFKALKESDKVISELKQFNSY